MKGTGYGSGRRAKKFSETVRQPRNQQGQEKPVTSELDAGSTRTSQVGRGDAAATRDTTGSAGRGAQASLPLSCTLQYPNSVYFSRAETRGKPVDLGAWEIQPVGGQSFCKAKQSRGG